MRVPEPFWGRVAETFHDIGERHASRELRGDIAHLLGDYYQRNKEYRLNELIEPAARASIASGEGTAGWWNWDARWTIRDGCGALMRIPGLTEAQRHRSAAGLVAVCAKQLRGCSATTGRPAENQVAQARWQLVSMLLDAGDVKGIRGRSSARFRLRRR